jgi:hypothetical protein
MTALTMPYQCLRERVRQRQAGQQVQSGLLGEFGEAGGELVERPVRHGVELFGEPEESASLPAAGVNGAVQVRNADTANTASATSPAGATITANTKATATATASALTAPHNPRDGNAPKPPPT